MSLNIRYSTIVQILLQMIGILSGSIFPSAESGSCQCTCTSNNAPNQVESGGGGSDGGIGITGPLPPGGSGGVEARGLPEDKRFCADSYVQAVTNSYCICYTSWRKDMDRVIYLPCLTGCNQWNNYYDRCKRATPDQTLEWYAYNCSDCNLKNNYLIQCVNKAAKEYLELLINTAAENNLPFDSFGC